MAELITSTEPYVNAWIVERAPGSHRDSMRIDVRLIACGAIDPHRWMLCSRVAPSNVNTNARDRYS